MTSDTTHRYKAYHKATHTVSKTRQVVMLYDGAIRFLQQAVDAIDKKEIERRYKALTRASEIVAGLQSCLDFENAEGVARVLFDFYGGIELRILAIHRTADQSACERIIADLKQMRDVWDHIDRGDASGVQAEAVAQAASAAPAPDAGNAAVSA